MRGWQSRSLLDLPIPKKNSIFARVLVSISPAESHEERSNSITYWKTDDPHPGCGNKHVNYFHDISSGLGNKGRIEHGVDLYISRLQIRLCQCAEQFTCWHEVLLGVEAELPASEDVDVEDAEAELDARGEDLATNQRWSSGHVTSLHQPQLTWTSTAHRQITQPQPPSG